MGRGAWRGFNLLFFGIPPGCWLGGQVGKGTIFDPDSSRFCAPQILCPPTLRHLWIGECDRLDGPRPALRPRSGTRSGEPI
ncbi:Hypothetical protein AA314_06753 [Archangium gephyra]|uniref:Uncharacterized protein n=1 Tax=Archangium gephyra TaxID=48 RepID=A0AAC8TGE8_9BACT|nr:Hypothetical protein AA314_06753 [Archangium gephyra]